MPLADGALLAGHVRAYPHGLSLMQHVQHWRSTSPHCPGCRAYTPDRLPSLHSGGSQVSSIDYCVFDYPMKEKAAEMCLCPECTLKLETDSVSGQGEGVGAVTEVGTWMLASLGFAAFPFPRARRSRNALGL